MDSAGVSASLLGWLRRSLGTPGLEFAKPPARIHGGFDTAIYAFRLADAPAPFAGPLVLRLYRAERGAAQARFEGAVHRAIAERGYPTPRALAIGEGASEPGAFLILEQVVGRNALGALLSPAFARVPALLADAQARLHALDAPDVSRHLAAAGVPLERLEVDRDLADATAELERLSLDGLRRALDWLVAERPAPRASRVVCHGDFHPLNVLVSGGAVSGVIDWTRMRIAPPEYDVGASVALMSQGEIALPALVAPVARAGRRALVELYLRAYRKHRALDPQALRYYEALRCLLFLVEAGEHHRADAGAVPRPSKATAFAAAPTVRRIGARVQEITRVEVALP